MRVTRLGEGSSNITYDYKNSSIENNFLIKFQNFCQKCFLVTLHIIWVTFRKFSLFRSRTWPQWSQKFPFKISYAFWTPHDWKFRFRLFDRRATKTWDPFWSVTNWVKFQNFSPGESISLQNLTPVVPKVSIWSFWLVCDQNLGASFWGATKWVKFQNFSPGESISLQNLTPVVPKVSLYEFLGILVAPQKKISIQFVGFNFYTCHINVSLS